MPSPEELAREKIETSDALKDWSSSDKTLSEGKARRVSAGSANQFQQFVTPDDGRKFTELYNVQHLQSAQLDRVSRVCISTIQRLYSMLRGEEIDAEIDERSGYELLAGTRASSLCGQRGVSPRCFFASFL
jgi:hypothetical protein